jgi:uncharacterized phage protein (TIGR02220 family)
MKAQKGSFIIHVDSLVVLNALTDAQAGQLLRVMRDYHSGDEIECDPIVRVAFMSFQAQFERDAIKYEGKCKRNSLNGAKGGRPKKEPTETQKTQWVISKPKKADSDSDSDSESDNESDSDTSLVVINHNSGLEKKNTQSGIEKISLSQSYINRFNEVRSTKYRLNAKLQTQFNARIKEGVTVDEMITSLTNAMADAFHIDNHFKYLTPEFFTRVEKIERYLNQTPKVQADTKLNRYTTVGDVQRTIEEMKRIKSQNTEP